MAVCQPITQRFSTEERHDVIQQTAGFSRVEDCEDVRMKELGARANLAEKSLRAQGSTNLRTQNLDGDSAVVPQIVRGENNCHSACTKLPLNTVPVGEAALEVRKEIGHRLKVR